MPSRSQRSRKSAPEGVVAQRREDRGLRALPRGRDRGVRDVAAEARQVEPLAAALTSANSIRGSPMARMSSVFMACVLRLAGKRGRQARRRSPPPCRG